MAKASISSPFIIASFFAISRRSPATAASCLSFGRTAGYIETWGRGIERITIVCKDAGRRQPLFEASSTEIKVTFFTDEFQKEFQERFTDKFVEKFIEKYVEKDVQRKIITLMLNQSTISIKAIAEEIGMSSRGVQKNIDALKKAGLVERVGAAKGGHWQIALPKEKN